MKTNRVIALMIGLLLTFSMTACGEQMSAMNTDMEGKTEAKMEEKSGMDMEEKMEESSDMNMMEGKTEEQLWRLKTTSSSPTARSGKRCSCPWIKT